MLPSLQKPRPKLLQKQDARKVLALLDRAERLECKRRSGGRCEVTELIVVDAYASETAETGLLTRQLQRRCPRRASQNHHLIGGSGRRNHGNSILSQHRLDVCDRCHSEITNHVLTPVDGTQREDAATVRYERVQ